MSEVTTDPAVEPRERVRGRLVLLAGGTSAAGRACARVLAEAGARVVVVGSNAARLSEAAESTPAAATELCDLTDPAAVSALRDRVHTAHGTVDGVIHLVGGWRGGGGLAGQSDEDLAVLLRSFTALRHISRTFDDDLRTSDAGRLAIVSSTAVVRPLAGGANYAAVKAASEAWTRAVAQGYAKSARDTGRELSAAGVIFRVRSLGGLEDALASAVVALWDDEAAAWNDVVVDIDTGG
ncbi:NAD(P)-dependent dehydrogenase (short-subunit alcohol dehydrogenase family) [Microbacterium testaceum]|uniref:SDR family NAD(P)-dependent oxidoreductase n=1 Tax=Microbacterium TaxID=33882 RepID=UPI0027819AF9|nr:MULTISPECIES: SDR family NAD(P)-dependent oxidoreductase [Microbacterium]MDQ1112665.1 NAD(P)-dependent dehydrogenase (short-subunit alcohol dehydrogenase family) [Microbacterium testaceum]MDR6096796.1 NAD(P)-dependent dehydrogenase (short-subunit alcohol dehydrogenase family) [Microbacterium sp. SORGH_AS_0454]